MKTIGGKRMCKLLESKGWKLARITGSHHIYLTEGRNIRITVPVHGSQDLKLGLQKFIMKLAEISEEEL
ncbi:MAG: type II toxin-antitoxin system HicA family toxin [Bacteroidetes bacterium]|nr:type II toxin-antitoxin system HicA family toxin [Bacteroidota bacterium]